VANPKVSNASALMAQIDANLTGELPNGDVVSLIFNDVSVGNGTVKATVGGAEVEVPYYPASGAPGEGAVTTPAFASGTAVQNTAAYRQTFAIATATAGSATIAIGPTSATATTLVTGKVLAATDLIQVNVPAGWFVKVTLTTSTGAANWDVF
jgi:hypothetical protein